MFRSRLFFLFLLLSTTYVTADEATSNGAVKGLLSSRMELQFATRMEGKTLFQIGEDVVRQGRESLKTGEPIAEGVAKNMKVTQGKADEITSWRIEGLETEIAPIRLHIHRLAAEFKEIEKPTAQQEKALDEWIRRFNAADLACKTEPSIAKLDALSDILLLEVNKVFLAYDRAEVKLLEAIMEASTTGKRLYHIETYFSQVMNLYIARDERTEKVQLTMDGVGLHPSVILAKLKKEKAVTGLGSRYGSNIRAIRERLQEVSGDKTLLVGQTALQIKVLKDLQTLEAELDNGDLGTIGKARDVLHSVEKLLYKEEKLAPAALRIGVGMYMSNQAGLFSDLAMQMKKNPKATAEYLIGGIKLKVERSKEGFQITFVELASPLSKQIDSVLQLAQQTLKQSQMGEADRIILTNAIEALRASQGAIGKPVRYGKWAAWSNMVNDIHQLYKF